VRHLRGPNALTALLSGDGLGLVRGERCLFRSLGFALNAGELLLVEGPNGSGKTSLLRLISGLMEPNDGMVSWNGKPIREVAQDYRAALVWLAHKTGFKQDLTLVENLRFERALRPASAYKFEDVLARLELATLTTLPMRALSAGQQRRVALARMLLSDARLWIMDEPFTNLDRGGQSLVGELIGSHLAAGGLCVAATHQGLSIKAPQQRLTLA
jgi:heme exporter protein A